MDKDLIVQSSLVEPIVTLMKGVGDQLEVYLNEGTSDFAEALFSCSEFQDLPEIVISGVLAEMSDLAKQISPGVTRKEVAVMLFTAAALWMSRDGRILAHTFRRFVVDALEGRFDVAPDLTKDGNHHDNLDIPF